MISVFLLKQRLKGDVVLLSAGRLLITAVEGKFTLVIRSIKFSDAGKYTVRAFNEAGESRFTATVVVKGQNYYRLYLIDCTFTT